MIFGAHRADAHEGAGGQLEVFRDAAVELQAQVDVRSSIHCTASPVQKKPSSSNALARRFGVAPVAGRDVRALVAHLGLAVGRTSLSSMPGVGTPR
jgi:hypothetical protein